MRQRVTFALLTGFLISGCVPSAGNSGSGGGNGNGSGGGNGSGSGGNGQSSGSGGGNGSGSGGSSSSGSGGSSASGSGGAAGPACTADPSNLVNAGSWICNADTPVKIQGAIYAYGDDGTSCKVPSPNKPCGGSGCCISGTTTPATETTMYKNWGCGLGVELNSMGGTPPVKSAYAGPVKCFNVTLTGTSGNNAVRIGFTQGTDDKVVAPFIEIGAIKDGLSQKICFADTMCPPWAAMQGCTKAAGADGTPFDMQLQVSAGATAATTGAYNLCITKIEPIVDGGSTGSGGSGGSGTCTSPAGRGTITERYGTSEVSCGGQKYIVQNNAWGSAAGQTVTFGPGTTYKITEQKGTGQNGAPASFPSVFIGQNAGHSTGDAPKAVSSIAKGSLPTSWTWAANGATGEYNAAYDVWFSTSSGGEPAASTPSGGFLMVWFYKPNMNQPIGSMMGTAMINGANWNIWKGTNMDTKQPCITYQAVTPVNTMAFKLGDFIRDAVDNQGGAVKDTWYLTNVFAGFEIWSGGVGLETKDFTAVMK